MPRPVLRDGQGDFRGGLNTASDEEALAENELRRAEEAVLTEYGAVLKRLGTQRLSDTQFSPAIGLETSGAVLLEDGDLLIVEAGTGGVAVQNGFAWLKDNGTQELLAVAGGKLYTAAYALPADFQVRSSGLKTTGTPSLAAFRAGTSEVVYIADGDTATSLNRWNGTAVSLNLANTPAGITQLAVYNQRLFGCTGSDQKIYWSAINNGDSLGYAPSGGGEAIIRTFSDQNITGLAPFGSSLLIFHTSGISRFTGLTQDDIAIGAGAQGLTSDVGAINGRSIVNTPQGIYFLSDRGFYVATETQVAPVSLKIDDQPRSWDLAQSAGVIGVHRRAIREVWWYVPNVGVLRYNYALNAWTGPCQGGYVSPATTCLWEAVDAEFQPIVLRGDASGYVTQCDAPLIYRDNVPTSGVGGTVFSMAVRCRRLFHGGPMNFKAYKWLYLTAGLRASTIAAVFWRSPSGSGSYTLPNPTGGGPGTWGTGTWGTGTWGAGTIRPTRIPISGYGEYLDITFTDAGEAQSAWSRVEVEGFDYRRRY